MSKGLPKKLKNLLLILPGAFEMGQFNKEKIEKFSIDILKDMLLDMYNSL